MAATSQNTTPVIQKVDVLLHVLGEECLEIYNKHNVTYERQKLFLLVQREEQFVDDFITELRKQLRNSDYGSLDDSTLVDQLVRGLRDSNLRERLLRVAHLDSKNAVDMCRAAGTSKFSLHFRERKEFTIKWQIKNCGLFLHLKEVVHNFYIPHGWFGFGWELKDSGPMKFCLLSEISELRDNVKFVFMR
ncbi:hypothetical protein AVEN_126469-1 [Araneus ventricosus]|uniref:Uncharacterized protein n=1 Tax=Araneus ventricosus TaxID=182803 RepID=A0A4Y2DKR5_ARAVE|nr:hypothetical protein AVEN_126469-1 [Araneus ventricosus]